MKKIICPTMHEVFTGSGKMKTVPGYCRISYEKGRLSISGVIGPKSNGDCYGSAGQCQDEIRDGEPNKAEGWTPELVTAFCDIWDRWHLNDMNPCCEHQRALGWMSEAKEEIPIYHYVLLPDAAAKQKNVQNVALSHLEAGKTFTPNEEQVFYANLNHFLDQYEPLSGELARYYKPYKATYSTGEVEMKKRGWVSFKDDRRGILSKPCPVCGYKYGSSWITEEVPEEVITFLESLPEARKSPEGLYAVAWR